MDEVVQPLSEVVSNNDEGSQTAGEFPKAILSVVREEFYGQDPAHPILEMTVRDGKTGEQTTLPEDLKGHVFIIGPAGTVGSPKVPTAQPETVLPAGNGWTTLLNGDGMVYRLDFHTTPITPYQVQPNQSCPMKSQPGKAWLTTRFVKPPSYYADSLTNLSQPSEVKTAQKAPRNLKFWDLGLFRLSFRLGLCNQINTGFLPVRFLGETNTRLLATNDASRPCEIDPCSLRTIAPVGLNRDWTPLLKVGWATHWIFQGLLSSAHPSFDSKTGEMFVPNIQQSIKTTLRLPLSLGYQGQHNIWKDVLEIVTEFILRIYDLLLNLLDSLGWFGTGSLHIIRWNGNDPVKKWVVNQEDNGQAVKIEQSSHMMGVTKNYLIVADTAFKITPVDLIPGGLIRPSQRWLDKVGTDLQPEQDNEINAFLQKWLEWWSLHLTYAQSADTYLYVIDRNQLKTVPSGQAVTAKKIKVEGEFTHFLTEYNETPDGHIVIHPAMNYATDAAQFIHPIDDSPYSSQEIEQELRALAGMWTAGMDVNGPAVVVLNPQQGTAKKCDLNLDEALRYTLFMGLYAYRDDMVNGQFDDIYWMGGGGWETMLTQLIYTLYADYKYRRVAAPEMLEILKRGVPSILSRVHIDRQLLLKFIQSEEKADQPVLSIQDSYAFPAGYFANSPQFVPRDGSQGSTNGYIVCNVVHSNHLTSELNPQNHPSLPNSLDSQTDWSDNSELWIFDAEHLDQGPLYKLSHPYLNFTLTLHTTWLRDLAAAPSSNYDIRADFSWLVEQAAKHSSPEIGTQIRELFEQIYQEFERD
ncbi:MAG: carotenoid oxygenase family protein (plasmid) [Leptolyngbya sp. BL-A-14]